MKCLRLIAFALPLLGGLSAAAHPFLCTDSYGGKIALVAEDGTIEWEQSGKHPQDCWLLANGNILYCHANGAIETTRQHEVVWEFKAQEGSEIHACQPLPNGNVLIVENGACRLLELDRSAKIAREIKLAPPPAGISVHDQFRGVRRTPAGHYLVCRKGEHEVEELDAAGKSLRRIPVPGDVHECLLLPDGHLLISCGDGHKIIELDETLKTVWEVNENDIPGNPLRLVAGLQRLPNGNTVICNYLGHGHLGEQPHVFEITPQKQLAWSFADHAHFKTINQIQLRDLPGDPAQNELLR